MLIGGCQSCVVPHWYIICMPSETNWIVVGIESISHKRPHTIMFHIAKRAVNFCMFWGYKTRFSYAQWMRGIYGMEPFLHILKLECTKHTPVIGQSSRINISHEERESECKTVNFPTVNQIVNWIWPHSHQSIGAADIYSTHMDHTQADYISCHRNKMVKNGGWSCLQQDDDEDESPQRDVH